ncbi:hypothetical protein RhiirA5_409429 [Rhizophagus irregularis]|uniref:Uncharacterized protein n=3 Tax=Rhizophagus irregularis TaxID=588596 RepID=A0A2I1F6Q2_9GLOM|nr:hypothetical protein GLOIN_2v1485471 [Rhizophagus irregularis DAOM 181602=DAOM 197198]EXX54020.1 hypothetical protein RirG_238520 [Rhizophagus irregularis DAOM 197198w]PKC14432.1 hypothetical protein RhiirA5_409429 [Rhizophagus irregularis]PKY30042.1 hypothetical protein RhiirB3_446937 [Rhizophagus irregularis]POG62369.1 hypothetical protein GLOIN_2v1485471 [Rhizophagus irregularis DAOM 181602=DAOM 197198]GET65454.1 hypothetical protein GLOIN_2v1485471 [Rhizophagus irregularis DAOM 181602=D|eukprot:XP_025169235.1 hypothetical protein GLOIN_2v1485471 [Rhizophagus irregularis DAOM 181602=DAOM 197198]
MEYGGAESLRKLINLQEIRLDFNNSEIQDHKGLFFNRARLIGEASHHRENKMSNLNKDTKETEEPKGREFNTYNTKVNSATSLYGEIIGQEKIPELSIKSSRVCTQAQTRYEVNESMACIVPDIWKLVSEHKAKAEFDTGVRSDDKIGELSQCIKGDCSNAKYLSGIYNSENSSKNLK